MWAQRGHKGCASTGTDAHINGTVGARVKHVITRGERVHGPHKGGGPVAQ